MSVVGCGGGAGPCSPRWSIGAAAADEVEDEGGRKKGRSVREKVEETLTRRPVGGARVGYFGIPGAGCR